MNESPAFEVVEGKNERGDSRKLHYDFHYLP